MSTQQTVDQERQQQDELASGSVVDAGAQSTEDSPWFARFGMLFLVLIFSIPTLGLLVSSFRTPRAVADTGWWTVVTSLDTLTIENYGDVINESAGGATLGEAFINTFVVAVPATIIPIMIAAFAAYAFSWMEFPGREILFVVFVGSLVIPLQVAFIPILNIYQSVGEALGFELSGSFLGVWLAHSGFGMPLAVYLLRNFIGSLPGEVIESAKIDGASHFQTFWRLIVPLSVPALASFAIFQFLWTWNDYLVALILLEGEQVATTYLAQLIGSFGEKAHLLMAGAFITMTVPLIVFFSLQRYFVRGLTAGSVKG